MLITITSFSYSTNLNMSCGNESSAKDEFTLLNSPPEIVSSALFEADEATSAGLSLTVQHEYALKITITDPNTLADINEINVTMYWYESDPNQIPANDNPSIRASFRWSSIFEWQLT